jgi:hypothetical protein
MHQSLIEFLVESLQEIKVHSEATNFLIITFKHATMKALISVLIVYFLLLFSIAIAAA